MPTITDAIRAQFIVDTTPIDRGMRKATASVRLGTRNMSSRFNVLKGSVGGVVAAMGGLLVVGRVAKGFFDINRETQRLQASLKTVTGSTELANQAFAGIERFAEETPFQVEQITEAFIRLSSLGLDPSASALRSYGNTAAAMGRDLMQFIEAVADASTGEFERLKDFGIKAKTQGDQISFLFQGVTTTVKNNAEEITGFLRSIGDVNFSSGMADQMKTINGIISNIKDNIATVARAIGGEGGVNSEIANFLETFRDWTQELKDNREEVVNWSNKIIESVSVVAGWVQWLQQAQENAKKLGAALSPVNFIKNFIAGMKNGQTATESLTTAWEILDMAANKAVSTTASGLVKQIETTKQFIVEVGDLVIQWGNLKPMIDRAGISLDDVAGKMLKVKDTTFDTTGHLERLNATVKKLPPDIDLSVNLTTDLKDNMESAGQSAAGMVAQFATGNRSLKSMLGNLVKIAAQAAVISIPGIGPAGGIISSFFGGLFKRGSAGRIQNGPVPMARSGMEIGNIGSRTKMIGVHSNEGVANAAFMDSFERKFGRGAFALANATGQAPGGDTFNFHFAPGTGASDQASIEKMVVQAISSAKRKLRL